MAMNHQADPATSSPASQQPSDGWFYSNEERDWPELPPEPESSGITEAKNSATWATGSSGSPPLFLATAREQSRLEKRNGSNGSRKKNGKPRTKSDAGCHVSDVTQE